jgi:hypothetical protein
MDHFASLLRDLKKPSPGAASVDAGKPDSCWLPRHISSAVNCGKQLKSYIMELKDIDPKPLGVFMQSFTKIRAISLALCGSLLFAGSAPVFAQHAGGHFGGFRGGHFGGFHGGFHGGFRGFGFWGPWGWGWGGLGLGLYFASLPYYYQTYWWGGVPYYYADNTYYRWNAGVGQYETVAPPAEFQNQPGGGAAVGAAGGGTSGELIAYPKNGQSQEQQSKDKYECHRWAAGQTGFDPSQGSAAGPVSRRSDYQRAQAACLEGRGYSVR